MFEISAVLTLIFTNPITGSIYCIPIDNAITGEEEEVSCSAGIPVCPACATVTDTARCADDAAFIAVNISCGRLAQTPFNLSDDMTYGVVQNPASPLYR